MNIDWQKIKEKYPKEFSLFREFAILEGFTKIEDDNLFEVYPYLLYSLFEKFFDEQGIEIFINKVFQKGFSIGYSFNIHFLGTAYYDTNVCNIRPVFDAIYKAFEILENQLNKGHKMTDQEKIIMFMWGKDKEIKRLGCPYNYMSEEIEADILTWSNEESCRIWQKILDNIKYRYLEIRYLDAFMCPYCIKDLLFYDNTCIDCFYGLKNNQCELESSTYKKINKYFLQQNIETYLTNRFYKELINKIEGDSNV